MRRLRDNALTLTFLVLLLGALVGQSLVGLADYNDAARTAHLAEIDWATYVTSSAFGVDVAENWQSEYLQFTLYIFLTVWLVQRGSAESKPPGQEGLGTDEQQRVGPFAQADSPRAARAGGIGTRVFGFSLTLVMAVIFLLSWATQAVAGRVALNEERIRDQLDPLTLGQYLGDTDFWGRTLQNWQSEFLAVASMAIFTVYLRQRGSPESKQVGAPHAETPGP
ncbi:hypothetical protein G7070_16980 [Propioniciclava coleopterorum]|uniref:Transmembrane protein n=1 Tax=Propioniciclava coleopterorum TaxID=2714937 RepID=A0A6G7YAD7_9ACTN|nr:DUF6766 family protein [Propioniciclava coleopterorum]QIK73646.1 hypothetical protein G7070_16980 [Propioniciclava coleopterorum]